MSETDPDYEAWLAEKDPEPPHDGPACLCGHEDMDHCRLGEHGNFYCRLCACDDYSPDLSAL